MLPPPNNFYPISRSLVIFHRTALLESTEAEVQARESLLERVLSPVERVRYEELLTVDETQRELEVKTELSTRDSILRYCLIRLTYQGKATGRAASIAGSVGAFNTFRRDGSRGGGFERNDPETRGAAFCTGVARCEQDEEGTRSTPDPDRRGENVIKKWWPWLTVCCFSRFRAS